MAVAKRWSVVCCVWGALFSGIVSANESLEVMAQNIVADYKAVRSECARLPKGPQKQACYYRLRIKQWDYQEAKAILKLRRQRDLVASN